MLLHFDFLSIQRKQERTSSLLCYSPADSHDSEDLIPLTMPRVRDEADPRRSSSSEHVQHFSNLVSDRAIPVEVPQLVGATVGPINTHFVGSLFHLQHQSEHKDSTPQNFLGFWVT